MKEVKCSIPSLLLPTVLSAVSSQHHTSSGELPPIPTNICCHQVLAVSVDPTLCFINPVDYSIKSFLFWRRGISIEYKSELIDIRSCNT